MQSTLSHKPLAFYFSLFLDKPSLLNLSLSNKFLYESLTQPRALLAFLWKNLTPADKSLLSRNPSHFHFSLQESLLLALFRPHDTSLFNALPHFLHHLYFTKSLKSALLLTSSLSTPNSNLTSPLPSSSPPAHSFLTALTNSHPHILYHTPESLFPNTTSFLHSYHSSLPPPLASLRSSSLHRYFAKQSALIIQSSFLPKDLLILSSLLCLISPSLAYFTYHSVHLDLPILLENPSLPIHYCNSLLAFILKSILFLILLYLPLHLIISTYTNSNSRNHNQTLSSENLTALFSSTSNPDPHSFPISLPSSYFNKIASALPSLKDYLINCLALLILALFIITILTNILLFLQFILNPPSCYLKLHNHELQHHPFGTYTDPGSFANFA